jgi:hypothetical protein
MRKDSVSSAATGQAYPHFHLDVLSLQAECLFGLGKHMEAADVVNSCMSDPHCEQHLGVLLAYAKFAAQYGKFEEAIRGLLKVRGWSVFRAIYGGLSLYTAGVLFHIEWYITKSYLLLLYHTISAASHESIQHTDIYTLINPNMPASLGGCIGPARQER